MKLAKAMSFPREIESGTYRTKGTKVPIVLSLGEQESYRYEGSVTIDEQPFDDGANGSVKLVLNTGTTLGKARFIQRAV